ncbi:hypothetical protein N0V83_000756 [Neocucurbitaria cava]|uniref:RING-type domain-containing protein n=1 Tax=Neocucurbitaria cava TaxID=798079 RepID=A0A9W8YHQ3_9PLEO|nr:hypothetical protein N0V83_000756 [Neocucurbitaria cava]
MSQSQATSSPPQNGSTVFTRDTLGHRAYDELFALSNHMVSQSEGSHSEAPSDMPEAEVLCPIEDEITDLATFGQHLSAKTTLKDHAEAIAAGESSYYLSNLAWTQDLLPLSNVDPPLFHLLCDSLYSHTPKDILGRWFGVRNYLLALGLSLSDLLYKAEMTPRRDWVPLVWVLYFLLLDHNEALADFASNIKEGDDDMNLQLSAYCTALRIRLYLWRMVRIHSTCRMRKSGRSNKPEYFDHHVKQIVWRVILEYNLLHEDYFQSVQRRIIGGPVKLKTITKPFDNDDHTAEQFCSLCQGTHASSDCVVPLNCKCIFGKECLESLLNRDMPSSYSCPNCRSHLHEPLEWELILSSTEQGRQLGLLWGLRNNVVFLRLPARATGSRAVRTGTNRGSLNGKYTFKEFTAKIGRAIGNPTVAVNRAALKTFLSALSISALEHLIKAASDRLASAAGAAVVRFTYKNEKLGNAINPTSPSPESVHEEEEQVFVYAKCLSRPQRSAEWPITTFESVLYFLSQERHAKISLENKAQLGGLESSER